MDIGVVLFTLRGVIRLSISPRVSMLSLQVAPSRREWTVSKILIIDDTPQYLELMTAVLASQGHTVVTHSQAQGAVQAAKVAAPDLLIVDAQLGEACGLDIIAELMEDEAGTDLRVLVCTAVSPDERSRCAKLLERYKHHLLLKPFDLNAFIDKVNQALNSPACS